METVYRLYSSLPDLEPKRAWTEIDLGALRGNYRALCAAARSNDPHVRPIAVVKADAYGHGAPECVRALLEEGCDFFAASRIDEALAVRNVCSACRRDYSRDADVIILGATDPALAHDLARFNLIQTILSYDYAKRLSDAAVAAGVTVRVHLAIDTGMNRLGFVAQNDAQIAASAAEIADVYRFSGISIEGMFTHFANADEVTPRADALTDRQADRFYALNAALEARGIRVPFLHLCNSAGTLRRPSDRRGGVRLGITLYGACPSDGFSLSLRPVMRLCTSIAHIHPLLPGEGVSYGGTFSADRERMIAMLPIGYADGFLRAYSGAVVSVETDVGVFSAPVVGRVCMDQCMIDVTGIPARVGNRVVLFGAVDGDLHALALRASTIDYEPLCLISSRVPRIYV